VDAGLLRATWPFGDRPFYEHQHRALDVAHAGPSFIVGTGRGSGKTGAFLPPVSNGIIQRKPEGRHGVQAILLYPMNVLANDRLERLPGCFVIRRWTCRSRSTPATPTL
jgi:ATP-dependent helicase YprA (DUF1998 family)